MAGIRRPLHLCKFLLRAIILLMLVFFFNCGKPTKIYRDGQLWVVNNLCSYDWIDNRGRGLEVWWQGEVIDIPNNMNLTGEPTGAGAVLITPEPLPGGTEVDFEYVFEFGLETINKWLSEILPVEAVIDGDITIDFYSRVWWAAGFVESNATLISGKSNDIHHYPDM